MKVNLIKSQTLRNYAVRHANSRSSVEDFIGFVKKADWGMPQDILATFGTADILGNGSNRIVFNINGNHHRLICTYSFNKRHVALYVNWIGTHREYDLLCKNGNQYTVNDY